MGTGRQGEYASPSACIVMVDFFIEINWYSTIIMLHYHCTWWEFYFHFRTNCLWCVPSIGTLHCNAALPLSRGFMNSCCRSNCLCCFPSIRILQLQSCIVIVGYSSNVILKLVPNQLTLVVAFNWYPSISIWWISFYFCWFLINK